MPLGLHESCEKRVSIAFCTRKSICSGTSTYRITNTPNSDTDTLGLVQTSLGDSSIIASVVTLDIELRDRNLLYIGSSKRLDGGGEVAAASSIDVALSTNAVDGYAGSHPLVDVLDHACGYLGVVGAVEVVVVDVKLSVRVSCPGCLEGDRDHVFAEDLVEDAAAEGAVFIEDFVGDVLSVRSCPVSNYVHISTGMSGENLHSHRSCPCSGS